MVVDAPARPADPVAAAIAAVDRGVPMFQANLPLPSGLKAQIAVPFGATGPDVMWLIGYLAVQMGHDMQAQIERQSGLVKVPAGFQLPRAPG